MNKTCCQHIRMDGWDPFVPRSVRERQSPPGMVGTFGATDENQEDRRRRSAGSEEEHRRDQWSRRREDVRRRSTRSETVRTRNSGDFYFGDTPYHNVNLTALVHSENSDSDSRTEGVGQQNLVAPTLQTDLRSLSPSPTPRGSGGKRRKRKQKKKRSQGSGGTGSQPTSKNLTMVNIGSGASATNIQVNTLDVARLARATSARGWDATRTRSAIEQFRPVVPMPQSRPFVSQLGPGFSFGTGGAAAQLGVPPPECQPTIPWPPPISQPPPIVPQQSPYFEGPRSYPKLGRNPTEPACRQSGVHLSRQCC